MAAQIGRAGISCTRVHADRYGPPVRPGGGDGDTWPRRWRRSPARPCRSRRCRLPKDFAVERHWRDARLAIFGPRDPDAHHQRRPPGPRLTGKRRRVVSHCPPRLPARPGSAATVAADEVAPDRPATSRRGTSPSGRYQLDISCRPSRRRASRTPHRACSPAYPSSTTHGRPPQSVALDDEARASPTVAELCDADVLARRSAMTKSTYQTAAEADRVLTAGDRGFELCTIRRRSLEHEGQQPSFESK